MKNLSTGRVQVRYCIGYGLAAGTTYLVAACLFSVQPRFSNTWWLYIGNTSFMAVAGISVFKCRKTNSTQPSMHKLYTGHLVTLAGIIFSVIILAAGLLLLPDPQLTNAPANLAPDKDNGLLWLLFMNAILVNFSCGSFISLIAAYAIKQKREMVS
jgi:hypothetical protein